MNRLFLLTILIFNILFVSGQEPLPRGMTEAERMIWDDYLKNYPADRGTAPPSEIPRTPSEWDEAQGVIITWASYENNLREIVRHAKNVAKVYIVCSYPTSVQNYLSQGGVNSENIEFIVADYNSVWVRDYGPQSIYLKGTNELAFVDWVYNRPRPSDDQVPTAVANYLSVPIYQMTQSPNRLVATGGNFMADGDGKGFSSKLILQENSSLSESQIDTLQKKYMGIQPYVKMGTLPFDGIHHIDMHIKLLDEETLLVGQYPTGVADGPQIEANLNYILNNFQTPYGRPYRVVRIPMPPDEYGQYPNQWSDYLTYTNSLILNNLVLVPIYGLAQDSEALSIYQEAMPGYNIVGINMRNVIPASGAIHCITKEIAANDPIFISHAPIRDEVEYSYTGYTFTANISSASGIQEASLYWSLDPSEGFNQVSMTADGEEYTATISYLPPNSKVHYYISATNNNEKTITKPLVAPQGTYTFEVGEQDLGFDFSANQTEFEIGDEVVFTYINQGVTANSFLWNFGEGANPSTADTEGPHTVTYDSEGLKDISLTINGDLVLTKSGYINVTYTEPTYFNLTIEIEGNGTTSPEIGTHQYEEGFSVTLTAIPDEGWSFTRWVVNSQEYNEPEVQLEMVEDIQAKAYFTDEGSGVGSIAAGKLLISPNPAGHTITVSFSEQIEKAEIAIMDIAGNTALVLQNANGVSQYKIDISALTQGIYVVVVKTTRGVWTSKFVKN